MKKVRENPSPQRGPQKGRKGRIMQILDRIETYTPQKQPIPAVVVSEPRIVMVPNPNAPGRQYRQVVADVVQQNPQKPEELYVQPDVLLNFATKREERVDPLTGESFSVAMLPSNIPGLDVDLSTGEVLGLRELLTRANQTILNRAPNQGATPATEAAAFED